MLVAVLVSNWVLIAAKVQTLPSRLFLRGVIILCSERTGSDQVSPTFKTWVLKVFEIAHLKRRGKPGYLSMRICDNSRSLYWLPEDGDSLPSSVILFIP